MGAPNFIHVHQKTDRWILSDVLLLQYGCNFTSKKTTIFYTVLSKGLRIFGSSQWLIAQLVECFLSVMKGPCSNLSANICWFRYWSLI
jgi:hypothetical protein